MTGSGSFVVTVSTTPAMIVPQNADRTGLIISNVSASTITLGFARPAAPGQGVAIPTGQLPIVLSRRLHGVLVTQPIWASAPAAATIVVAESVGT